MQIFDIIWQIQPVENRYFLFDFDDLSCSHLRGPEITELSGQWFF